MKDLIPVDLKQCQLTRTEAIFDKCMSFQDWLARGRQLNTVSDCVNWWIGDWANFGVKAYGDKSHAALTASEITGFEAGFIRACAWVSERVVTRVTSLSWSHHREVAALDAQKEQLKWLRKAQEEGWSVSDLRQAIRVSKGEQTQLTKGETWTFAGWISDGLRRIRQLDNMHPIEQWEEDERKRYKEELKPLVEIYQRL